MSKFKNYKNSINQSDRIYSVEDINKMPLRDFKTNSQVLLAQNSAIGLPNESELASSPNAVYVEPYTRADGTHVRGYWRSRPDGDGAPAESQSGVQKLYGYISNKDEKKEETVQNTAEMQKKNNNQKQIYLDKNNNIQIGDYKIGKPEKESWYSGGKYVRNPLRVVNRMLNYKHPAAREMFDLSARKPELLVNRPHYIVANDADKETLRKQNIFFNNNKPTLIFTPKSPEYKAVVTSKDMKNELKKWFANEKIEGKVRPDKFSVILGDNSNIVRSIQGATIRNVRDNGDGTISFVLTDLYDFKYDDKPVRLSKKEKAILVDCCKRYFRLYTHFISITPEERQNETKKIYYDLYMVAKSIGKQDLLKISNNFAERLQYWKFINNYNAIIPITIKKSELK